ncbi:hypothetical protein COX53_00780, partial [candidate division WWE3 bacterium CG23_combo_of_CG06-09_8_20_14_all_40_14]
MLTLLKQIFLFPYLFMKGRFMKTSGTLDNLKNNTGKIVEIEGKKVAVYKNEKGEILKLSPICPHLGCIVEWEDKNKNWLCPCHKSAFNKEGKY